MQKVRQFIPWAMAAGRALLGPVVLLGDRCGWNGFTLAGLVVSALLSDIFDGVLARRWRVDTAAVRLFDSMCDMVFYASVGIALWSRIWNANALWLVVLLALEAANIIFALVKFGRPASYHSYLAKTWGLVLASAIVAVFATGYVGLLMCVAILMGIVSNLETMAMSLMLPIWRRDVKTLAVAWQIRQLLVSHSAWRRTMRQQTRWTSAAIVAVISSVAVSTLLAQTRTGETLDDRKQAGEMLSQETQARGYWVDPSTGLRWAAKDSGKDLRWKRAVKYCRNMRLNGHADWRLPSLAELEAISDRNAESPGLGGRPKKPIPMNWHVKGGLFLTGRVWSSNLRLDDRGKPVWAWHFDFINLRAGNENNDERVLCARQP